MKTKKFVALLLAVLGLILLFLIINTKPFAVSAQTDNLKLNEDKRVKLAAGETLTFYHTPDASMHYVVETTGKIATRLKVSNIPAGEIINGGRYTDDNARIWFKAEQGRQIKIELKFDSVALSGSTTIQIRKQKFSMFGYVDDNGMDTRKDLNKPYDKFNGIYDCKKYENMSAQCAYANDYRFIPNLNSEIFFFSGHGYSDGSGITFYCDRKKYDDITIRHPEFKMDKTRVAVFSACNSAYEDDTHPLCIARLAVVTGAYASVGFPETIVSTSARTFTNKFFTKLSEGATVRDAAKSGASAVIWAWDNVKNYTIFGRFEITVVSDSTSASTFSLKPNVDLEYLRDEVASGYVAEPMSESETRYYQTVNGYLTDSYIDITEENGRIVDFDDKRKTFDSVLEIEDDYLNKGCAENVCADGAVYNLKAEKEEHIVYCNLGGVMTPVKVSFASYVNEHGCAIYEASCINLNDGSAIDYGDICCADED